MKMSLIGTDVKIVSEFDGVDAQMIVASYTEENILIKISFYNIDIPSLSTEIVDISKDIQGHHVKVFLWHDIINIQPYSEPLTHVVGEAPPPITDINFFDDSVLLFNDFLKYGLLFFFVIFLISYYWKSFIDFVKEVVYGIYVGGS